MRRAWARTIEDVEIISRPLEGGQETLFPPDHDAGKRQRKGEYTRYSCACGKFRTAWYAHDGDALAAIGRHLEAHR
jgi:hypothetical protein